MKRLTDFFPGKAVAEDGVSHHRLGHFVYYNPAEVATHICISECDHRASVGPSVYFENSS